MLHPLVPSLLRRLLVRPSSTRRPHHHILSKTSLPPSCIRQLSTLSASNPEYWPPWNADFAYDWKLPTYQVYKNDKDADTITALRQHNDDEENKDSSADAFTPTFALARSHLDYSYHSNPVLHRQILQDAIMGRVLAGAPPFTDSNNQTEDNKEQKEEASAIASSRQLQHPWIVFTAGPMGVGKGYVLTKLQQYDLFPAADFVQVDPDMIKSELPEQAGYLQRDRALAATKLHRESTQIADVLFEHAILDHRSVLVDGSLRDVDYYKSLFLKIHRDFPDYRIAILYVTADHDVIVHRAEKRAEKTGRVVPRELLEESMKQVPRSVSLLSKLADATHVIANNEDKPLELVSSHVREGKDATREIRSWDDFAQLWRQEDPTTTRVKSHQHVEAPICHMDTSFECTETHDVARGIWSQSYPNFCPRCAVACDGQCGICIHGRHMCACPDCNDPQQRRCSTSSYRSS